VKENGILEKGKALHAKCKQQCAQTTAKQGVADVFVQLSSISALDILETSKISAVCWWKTHMMLTVS
jgi:hypothetical protein